MPTSALWDLGWCCGMVVISTAHAGILVSVCLQLNNCLFYGNKDNMKQIWNVKTCQLLTIGVLSNEMSEADPLHE